jgi:hypothetical protein
MVQESDVEIEPALWREMAARHAIQRVIARYGRGVDERDFERVRSCFHASATITYGSGPTRSRDEAIVWLEQVTPALFALSHYFGPADVELSQDGLTAICQTWCLNVLQHHRSEAGVAVQLATGLLYDDVFTLVEDEWLISERRNRTEWSLEVEGNSRLPIPGEKSAVPSTG